MGASIVLDVATMQIKSGPDVVFCLPHILTAFTFSTKQKVNYILGFTSEPLAHIEDLSCAGTGECSAFHKMLTAGDAIATCVDACLFLPDRRWRETGWHENVAEGPCLSFSHYWRLWHSPLHFITLMKLVHALSQPLPEGWVAGVVGYNNRNPAVSFLRLVFVL